MAITSDKIKLGQIEPIPFSSIVNKPTTLDGYGIIDALTELESNDRYLRYDSDQSLSPEQQGQALLNLGLSPLQISDGDGIDIDVVEGVRVLSFDTVFGDNRYHRRLSLLSNTSAFQYNEGLEGIQLRQNGAGSSNFPTTNGATAVFYSGGSDSSQANGRTFALNRSFDTEDYFIGSPRANGVSNAWRRLYHNGDFSLNTVLRTGSTEQTRTGLLRLRRGTNQGEQLHTSFEYPDGAGETYNLRLFNEGGESVGNTVVWSMKQNYNDNRTNYVLGFQYGMTVIGNNRPSTSITNNHRTELNSNIGNPSYRYPITLYNNGDLMSYGRGYFGKDNLSNTLFLTSNDPLYSEGTIYARGGLRTPEATNKSSLDASVYFLGAAQAHSGPDTPTHDLLMEVDGVVYRVFARLNGS